MGKTATQVVELNASEDFGIAEPIATALAVEEPKGWHIRKEVTNFRTSNGVLVGGLAVEFHSDSLGAVKFGSDDLRSNLLARIKGGEEFKKFESLRGIRNEQAARVKEVTDERNELEQQIAEAKASIENEGQTDRLRLCFSQLADCERNLAYEMRTLGEIDAALEKARETLRDAVIRGIEAFKLETFRQRRAEVEAAREEALKAIKPHLDRYFAVARANETLSGLNFDVESVFSRLEQPQP